MPLAFRSRSHGTVAFGFFHIESDMLLLEQQFFFADRFCQATVDLAGAAGGMPCSTIPGWRIETPAAVGDLAGAMRGERLPGFIGAMYERFPFPALPEDFRQSPDGALTRALAAGLIAPFGAPVHVDLGWDRAARRLTVGTVVFDEAEFARLLAYLDRGGHPRWRDGVRPGYVTAMLGALEALASPLRPGPSAARG